MYRQNIITIYFGMFFQYFSFKNVFIFTLFQKIVFKQYIVNLCLLQRFDVFYAKIGLIVFSWFLRHHFVYYWGFIQIRVRIIFFLFFLNIFKEFLQLLFYFLFDLIIVSLLFRFRFSKRRTLWAWRDLFLNIEIR